MCFVPRLIHSVTKYLLVDCLPLSVRRCDEIPNIMIHMPKNMETTILVVISAVRTAQINLEYLSVTIETRWISLIFLSGGSVCSIETNPRGLAAESS